MIRRKRRAVAPMVRVVGPPKRTVVHVMAFALPKRDAEPPLHEAVELACADITAGGGEVVSVSHAPRDQRTWSVLIAYRTTEAGA